jgi:hypothetical protein
VVLTKDNGGFGPDLSLSKPDLGAACPNIPLISVPGTPRNPPPGHCVVGCWIQLKPTE